MTVSIGQTPEHSFDEPIGLLSDCHRRIEKFLGVQVEVAATARGGVLDGRQREALEKSLRYFHEAAPWHTADEESSLFPRLRSSDDPAAREALAQVDRLEADHRDAEADHAEVERIIRRWLDTGELAGEETERLLDLLRRLRSMYREHIALEDEVLFPLAERLLSAAELGSVGREMAERRGVDFDLPGRRCKHGRAAAEG